LGVTVRVALRFTPPAEPVIVTGVELATAVVVTAKLTLREPAATVALAGTLATAALLLARVTTVPPGGAAALRVAVPVACTPPTTLAGLSASVPSASGGASTVMSAVWVSFRTPVIVTGVSTATGEGRDVEAREAEARLDRDGRGHLGRGGVAARERDRGAAGARRLVQEQRHVDRVAADRSAHARRHREQGQRRVRVRGDLQERGLARAARGARDGGRGRRGDGAGSSS
jgi:hypothetical protein